MHTSSNSRYVGRLGRSSQVCILVKYQKVLILSAGKKSLLNQSLKNVILPAMAGKLLQSLINELRKERRKSSISYDGQALVQKMICGKTKMSYQDAQNWSAGMR